MTPAISMLIQEHRIIERVLDSFEIFVNQLGERNGSSGDNRHHLSEFTTFFREFADHCHHGKEEEMLFAAMSRHGFPRDAGPLLVMVGEHNLGRGHIKEMAALGVGSGTLTTAEIERVRSAAAAFIPLLRMHIQKEDQILFPAAQKALPDEVLAELASDFGEFETTAIGAANIRRLEALGLRLQTLYPARDAA